jgi:hypothetical protein
MRTEKKRGCKAALTKVWRRLSLMKRSAWASRTGSIALPEKPIMNKESKRLFQNLQ